MSKVADLINSNESSRATHIFFDPDSVDSLLGTAILKYACEEITDANEILIIEPINRVNDQIYVVPDTEILINKNITFVGCIPDAKMISYLASLHKKDLLFVLCDEEQYNEAKGYGASIEYSTEDSCALTLYKIIFGELNDGIPDIIKIVSKGVMKQYDDTYEDYLRFIYGFSIKYLPIADYARLNSIYLDVRGALFNKTITYITDYDQIMNDGLYVILNMNKVLATHMSGIKSDPWKVNGNSCGFAFFSNGPMLPENLGGLSMTNYFTNNILITFYRKNSKYWIIELFKTVHSDKIQQRDANNERIEEIEALLNYDDSSIDDKSVIELNNEKKKLVAENNVLNSVIDFDCGKYLKKYYGGGGITEHGAAKITNKNFLKIIENRTI